MVLSKEQIEQLRQYYNIIDSSTRAQLDVHSLLDTIASKDTQIQQMQEHLDKCMEALSSTLKRAKMIELPQNYELFHRKAIEALQAIE